MRKVVSIRGDITRERVDAIVNAASKSLAGGGGVDGAIHLAAGPGLAKAATRHAPCKTGEVVLTHGFRLLAHFVIHTVGPVYREHTPKEAARLLANCYRNALVCARDHGLRSVSFPAISTGAFGYPIEEATRVAFRTVRAFLDQEDPAGVIEEVRFVCFSDTDLDVYHRVNRETNKTT